MHRWRGLTSLLVLLLSAQLALSQDDPAAGANANIPASFFAPIGGGGAPPADNNNNPTPGAAVDLAAPAVDPNAQQSQPAVDPNAQVTPAADPNAGAQPAVDPNANAQPATDPNANAQPAVDPNANAQPAVDPNAQDAPATDPNAGAQPAFDPNALPGAAVDPNAQPGALVDPNAQPGTVVPIDAAPAPVPVPVPVPEVPTEEDKKDEEDDKEEEDRGPPGPDDNRGTSYEALAPDNLPPAPPMSWQTLEIDTAIVFGMELYGDYLAPWTKTKSWVYNNVIRDRYLRSVALKDIETGPVNTYVQQPSPPEDARRRLFDIEIEVIPIHVPIESNRRLKQVPINPPPTVDPSQVRINSGVQLRMTVRTSSIRVESEVRSIAEGVSSGSLAKDLCLTGILVANVSLTEQPKAMPYDQLEDPNADSTDDSLPTWAIGVIVGVILVLLPVPVYIYVQHKRKKHREAVERQQQEATMLRQKMQSRIIKPGGRTFTVKGLQGDDSNEIMVHSSSMGTMYQYNNNTPRPGESLTMSRVPSYSRSLSIAGMGNYGSPNGAMSPNNGSFTMQHQRTMGGTLRTPEGGTAYTPSPGVFNPGLPTPLYYNGPQSQRSIRPGSAVHPMMYSDGASASSDEQTN